MIQTIGVLAIVFVAFLTTSSSATPILFDRLIGEHLDALADALDNVLSSDRDSSFSVLFPPEFESQAVTRLSPWVKYKTQLFHAVKPLMKLYFPTG